MRHAEAGHVDLAQLPLDVLQRFSPLIGDDVYGVLTLDGSVASRNRAGGTAPEQVRSAIRAARGASPPLILQSSVVIQLAPPASKKHSSIKEQPWRRASLRSSVWA